MPLLLCLTTDCQAHRRLGTFGLPVNGTVTFLLENIAVTEWVCALSRYKCTQIVVKIKLSTTLTRNESVMILNQQPGKIKIYNRKGAVQDGSFPSHYKKENYWTSFVLCIVFFFHCILTFWKDKISLPVRSRTSRGLRPGPNQAVMSKQ